ncbi:hypothetical protein Cgig2_002658 [Carnegiea gigantea]|uniref:Ubiquitin-like protease family profile domain-containing protein n=1 Tax=Carnegiea gigantea TaxID=171969 RepID=A0A9Q1GH26_9CARY|nr:hypothetical protein Cgig2_002658 [Carnegiea gigantea]
MQNSTHNMQNELSWKIKMHRLHAKRIVSSEIHLRHISSDIISLTSVVKENSNTLKMLNVNVNRFMKHVVGNETTISNKHMTDTCATTCITYPSNKQKRRIVAEHNFSKDDMRAANELTKSISVGGLNFLHKEDKKVNVNKVYIPMNDRTVHWFLIIVDLQRRRVALLKSLPFNKSNDFRWELAKDLARIGYLSCTFLSKMEKFTSY